MHNCEAVQVFCHVAMSHVHKLEARTNRKFILYGMWPELWWSNLYSKPRDKLSQS